VKERTLDLLVDDATLAKREAVTDAAEATRGYKKLYADHVLQAHEGCDFDFLQANGD
jgi:dihydroxy-acid dehydratase